VPAMLQQAEVLKKLVEGGHHRGGGKMEAVNDQLVEAMTYQMESVVIPAIRLEAGSDASDMAARIKVIKDCENKNGDPEPTTQQNAHSKCRDEEKVMHTAMHTECADWKTFRSLLVPPSEGGQATHKILSASCPSEVNVLDPHGDQLTPYANIIQYLEDAKSWYTEKETTGTAALSKCSVKTTAWKAKDGLCDTAQKAYETNFCTWKLTGATACQQYKTCYETSKSAFINQQTNWTTRETNREASYKAAKLVTCYLGQMNATKVNLGACTGLSTDVSSVKNVVPTPPQPKCQAYCSIVPIGCTSAGTNRDIANEYPCSRFTAKPWSALATSCSDATVCAR